MLGGDAATRSGRGKSEARLFLLDYQMTSMKPRRSHVWYFIRRVRIVKERLGKKESALQRHLTLHCDLVSELAQHRLFRLCHVG